MEGDLSPSRLFHLLSVHSSIQELQTTVSDLSSIFFDLRDPPVKPLDPQLVFTSPQRQAPISRANTPFTDFIVNPEPIARHSAHVNQYRMLVGLERASERIAHGNNRMSLQYLLLEFLLITPQPNLSKFVEENLDTLKDLGVHQQSSTPTQNIDVIRERVRRHYNLRRKCCGQRM